MSNVHIIENHDMALEIWRKNGVYDSILVHIDAHFDYVMLKDTYYINIGNFLTYAASENLFKGIYWVVPDIFWEDSVYAQIIISQLPHCFEVIDIKDKIIKLKNTELPHIEFAVVGIDSAALCLEKYLQDDLVCVDIDIDYIMNPMVSQVYSYKYPPKNWCTVYNLYAKLYPLVKKQYIITIANSFYGGYTPLLHAYLSEYLYELFRSGTGKNYNEYKLLENGANLLTSGNYIEAINCYRQVKGSFLAFLSAQIGLLYSYVSAGNIYDAKKAYSYLETNYKKYEAYFFPVSGLLLSGQLCLAKKVVEQWLQVDNLSEQANLYYLKCAYSTMEDQNDFDIEKYVSKITDVGTEYEKSYVLGNIYLKRFEYQKAIDSLNSVLAFLRSNRTPAWCGQISSFENHKNHGVIIWDIYEKLKNAHIELKNYKIAKKYAVISLRIEKCVSKTM